ERDRFAPIAGDRPRRRPQCVERRLAQRLRTGPDVGPLRSPAPVPANRRHRTAPANGALKLTKVQGPPQPREAALFFQNALWPIYFEARRNAASAPMDVSNIRPREPASGVPIGFP